MLKRAEKIEITKELTQQLKDADGFVICSYQGLTSQEVNTLRRSLFEVGSKVLVFKNRLLKKALAENGITTMDAYLKESTMVVIGKEDAMTALSALGKFAKDHEHFGFKAGLVAGRSYDTQEIIEISKLPGRIDLIAMVLGGMNSVFSQFCGTLEALATKKESEA